MHEDQDGPVVTTASANAEYLCGENSVAFERLLGTTVSRIAFIDNRGLEVEGSDPDGQARWKLTVFGSARFTFSHGSENSPWLVEANFDPGGTVRKNDQAMISATCGAVVASVRADEIGLAIASDDGRGIEVPLELNEDGIGLEILPDDAHPTPCRIELAGEL